MTCSPNRPNTVHPGVREMQAVCMKVVTEKE